MRRAVQMQLAARIGPAAFPSTCSQQPWAKGSKLVWSLLKAMGQYRGFGVAIFISEVWVLTANVESAFFSSKKT